jgi:hypothetical protein
MTRTVTAAPEPAATPPAPPIDGWHVFGVVPAGASPPEGGARLVPHGDVAALVAELPAGRTRRTRQRLLAHAELLDRTAGTTAVLPVRFGTVTPSLEAVVRDVLAPHHDTLVAALAPLAGRAQFLLRASYLPDVVVGEVLCEDPRVRHGHQLLRRRSGGGSPGHDRHRRDHAARMRLGEMLARGVSKQRDRDTTAMVDALAPYAAATLLRPARSLDAEGIGDVAFLVDLDRRDGLESAAEELGRRWHGRARLRLLGPMAAYEFAGELVTTPGGR